MNSKRDRVKDAIRGHLAEYYRAAECRIDIDLVCDIADSVFDALGISERAQDRP